MDDKYWEVIAKMFEEANKAMAEMNKTLKEVAKTISKVKNPFEGDPERNWRKRRNQFKAAEVPWRELKYKDNGNNQSDTKN